jgi:homoserine O-acetyltransferase
MWFSAMSLNGAKSNPGVFNEIVLAGPRWSVAPDRGDREPVAYLEQPPDTEALPASGAWFPGHHPGRRRFFDFGVDRAFALEAGGSLRGATVAYETWGQLDATASNAVLVCHALTSDSHAVGEPESGHPGGGWWNQFLGAGQSIDPDRYFIVCANLVGGCQGSTGPSSIDPETGTYYAASFPTVTIRDNVRIQALLASHLGINSWLAVVGGSMGGMTALEWAVTYPGRVRGLVALATTPAATAQQISWSFSGRSSVLADIRFRGGDYYDAGPGRGPHAGLMAARMLAMVHYRSDGEFTRRFNRLSSRHGSTFEDGHMFDVERYLSYQAHKFVRRFDANTYLVLNRMMDLHDVGRKRGGVAKALERVSCPLFTASVTSDHLYPEYQQLQIKGALDARGIDTTHVLIDTDTGHDGFLTDADQVAPAVGEFIDGLYKDLHIGGD